jgi:hypothetical protein
MRILRREWEKGRYDNIFRLFGIHCRKKWINCEAFTDKNKKGPVPDGHNHRNSVLDRNLNLKKTELKVVFRFSV